MGALDGLTKAFLPPVHDGTYPLTTRMRDGSLVMVEEAFLASKLQDAVDQLEAKGVIATILLCAGPFAELKGTRPSFKPFATGRNVLNSLGLNRIGLISPIKEQEAPIRQRWQAAGFQPTVWTADLAQQDKQFVQQLNEQIEYLGLDRNIQSRYGLISNDKFRIKCEGSGNRNTLSLTAAKLVGIAVYVFR